MKDKEIKKIVNIINEGTEDKWTFIRTEIDRSIENLNIVKKDIDTIIDYAKTLKDNYNTKWEWNGKKWSIKKQ